MSEPDPVVSDKLVEGKTLFGAMSGIGAMLVLSPLANQIDLPMPLVYVAVLAMTLPIALVSRGMICLLVPAQAAVRAYAIRLGAVVVLALLLLSPFSLRIAWLNHELKPRWLAHWCIGMAILLAYAGLLIGRLHRTRSAT
jgi:hypothetical protein